MTDFLIQNEGTISILHPKTEAAKEWVAEHLPEGSMSWAGGTVIEHRYVGPIIEGIQGDGLSVE